MCRCAERSAAAAHAASVEPAAMAGHAFVRDHGAQRAFFHRDERSRAVDHLAHGRVFGADHFVGRDQRRQPVGEIDDVGSGDAREEVLVAAGKADHFVREHRPADQQVIVLQHQAVQPHRHLHAQLAARQRQHLVFADRAQGGQRVRIVPGVVQHPHGGILGRLLRHRQADQLAQRLFRHRRMGAQRHQVVQALDPRQDVLGHQAEEQRQRHRPRGIGDDDQHALIGQSQMIDRARDDRFDVALGQHAGGSVALEHLFTFSVWPWMNFIG